MLEETIWNTYGIPRYSCRDGIMWNPYGTIGKCDLETYGTIQNHPYLVIVSGMKSYGTFMEPSSIAEGMK